jgi:hypothetical protein
MPNGIQKLSRIISKIAWARLIAVSLCSVFSQKCTDLGRQDFGLPPSAKALIPDGTAQSPAGRPSRWEPVFRQKNGSPRRVSPIAPIV